MSKLPKTSKVPNVSNSNVLLIEVPPPFTALCDSGGVTPQAALRGLVTMVCGLRFRRFRPIGPLGQRCRRCRAPQ